MKYCVVYDRYGGNEAEMMRMSLILTARTRAEALEKGAVLFNPAYRFKENKNWFKDSSRPWSQAVYELPEPVRGYPTTINIACKAIK